jgi:hypothetical protein
MAHARYGRKILCEFDELFSLLYSSPQCSKKLKRALKRHERRIRRRVARAFATPTNRSTVQQSTQTSPIVILEPSRLREHLQIIEKPAVDTPSATLSQTEMPPVRVSTVRRDVIEISDDDADDLRANKIAAQAAKNLTLATADGPWFQLPINPSRPPSIPKKYIKKVLQICGLVLIIQR